MDVLMVTIPPLLEGGDGVGVLRRVEHIKAWRLGYAMPDPFRDFRSQASALTGSQPQGELRLFLKSSPLPHSFAFSGGVSCRCLFDSAEPLHKGRQPAGEV